VSAPIDALATARCPDCGNVVALEWGDLIGTSRHERYASARAYCDGCGTALYVPYGFSLLTTVICFVPLVAMIFLGIHRLWAVLVGLPWIFAAQICLNLLYLEFGGKLVSDRRYRKPGARRRAPFPFRR
jgi:ribosomal protein S27E